MKLDYKTEMAAKMISYCPLCNRKVVWYTTGLLPETLECKKCNEEFPLKLFRSDSGKKDLTTKTNITLKRTLEALKSGAENTQELLSIHDQNLGRTTLKNRNTAERLEDDIQEMGLLADLLIEMQLD